MPIYRIYSLDRSGHIVTAFDAYCSGEDAAVAQASEKFGVSTMFEIWEGTRLVRPLSKNTDANSDAAR
jgi:hypothetical protein